VESPPTPSSSGLGRKCGGGGASGGTREERSLRRALRQGSKELVAEERARKAAGAAGGASRVTMGDVGDLDELKHGHQQFMAFNRVE
jgi:hypothetical protein